MDIIYPHCCGLNIPKKATVACLFTSAQGLTPVKEVRTFPTMMADWLALAAWLHAVGCTRVAVKAPASGVRSTTS